MNGRLLLALLRRPRGVALLALGLALAGLYALRAMPISAIPSVDLPTILVTGSLPGASPETMATLVAAPLEESLGTISGIQEITSTSVQGASRIVIQFEMHRSASAAARDVQAAISAARNRLPKDMPAPPVYQKINPEDAPVLFLAITSGAHTPEQLFDLAHRIIVPEISRQRGVGGAFVQGAERSAVRVRADLEALRAMGLDLGDVRAALVQANRNSPKGELSNGMNSWAILANDQVTKAADYRDTPVASRDGRLVRLDQIAVVEEGIANERTAGWFNGRKAVFVFVQREAGANLLETAANVRAAMNRLKSTLPASVDLDIVADRSDTVIPMIEDATLALLLTMFAVALVVIFALRDRNLALVAVINVPLSLLGTVLVMKWLGFSLNIISLGGMTVSVGLMVDDAIVVVENIQRLRASGRTNLMATLRGTQEVTFTIVAITLALVATLSPLLVLSGPVGAIVSEFAATVSAAVLISGILSLTLTPALVARLAKRHAAPSPSVSKTLRQAYARTLRWTVDRPTTTLLATVAICLAVLPLWSAVPKTFLPIQDTGMALGIISARPDTSFAAMSERMQQASRTIAADPAVQSVSTYLGSMDASVTNTGRTYIALKPVAQGRDSMSDVIERLRDRLADIPGIETSLEPIEDLRVGGREGVGVNQFTLRGETAEELALWTPRMVERMRRLPSVENVNSNQAAAGGHIQIEFNRDQLARLGGSQAALNDALNSSFGQRQIVLIDRPFDQMPVVLESATGIAADSDEVGRVFITGQNGQGIPLPAVARTTIGASPVIVTHDGLMPAATISFSTAPGHSLGEAMNDIDRTARSLNLPGSIKPQFTGNAGAFEADLFGQPVTFLLACLAVYLVLGILYESFLLPLAILATLPVAAVGSLLGLALFGLELSVVAFMGLLLVAGIMMKNAIILVNFAVAQQRAFGLAPAEAMHHAGAQRFRPIVMTSVAALLGALPIAFATGLGAEFREPLGVAVVGGLIVAQAVTLYTTPAVYVLLDRFGRRARQWLRGMTGTPLVKAA